MVIKTGTNVTGGKQYTTSDGRTFTNFNTAIKEEIKIIASKHPNQSYTIEKGIPQKPTSGGGGSTNSNTTPTQNKTYETNGIPYASTQTGLDLTQPITKTPSPTTTQKLTQKLANNYNNTIKIIPNQDVPTITNEAIYNTEKQVTQNILNQQQTQATIDRINRLKFKAEQEAGLKTPSPTTDLYNTEALSQRQISAGQKKQQSDEQQVNQLNQQVTQFNTNYELFLKEYENKDQDKTTPILELNEQDYESFTRLSQMFEKQKNILDKKQTDVENLFKARTIYKNTINQEKDPLIKALFDTTTPKSEGTTAGINEFQRIEAEKAYAGTPAQKAFAGKNKNTLTAILSTPQIYNEQYEQTGSKTINNPYLNNSFINPDYKNTLATTIPEYTNIFDNKKLENLKAPTTYEEELEFKKQIGFRAGLKTATDPYDAKKLKKDLNTFSTDVILGTTAGAVIGTIVPVIGTTVGATTGLLTGAVGGTTNVITENIVTRQTGSEFLGESLGTVTGIGAEILSAGAISKAVVKTISVNPRLIGNPTSIAYNIGNDKIRLIRSSQFKTGTGFLTRKFDVIDDVIIKRSDLLKNLTKTQTNAIFKQATNAPKFLTDDVIKSRIKIGKGNTSITNYDGVFKNTTGKKIPLNELLNKLDITEFSGVQRISMRTGKDLLIKTSKKIKPTIYDDSIESVTGFGKVKEAEKTILIKKGTKTFQFEGIGYSYSQADEITEGIIKAQKGIKTSTKKLSDIKLLNQTNYTKMPQKEKLFKLNYGQKTTDLQEDFIFIKAKQKGTRLFTNEADDYSKFISQTKQKGFGGTIIKQGDEIITSPTTKFKQDILTFKGNKGEGQIIRTSTKGLPDEFTLSIANKADDYLNTDSFIKAKVTKASTKADDFLGLNPTSLNKSKELKLLKEGFEESQKPILQKELEKAIIAYEKSANPTTLKNLQNLSKEMASVRAYPAIIAERLNKQVLNTKLYDRFIKEEFFNKKSLTTIKDTEKLLGFAQRKSLTSIEDTKKIIDFAENGSRLSPENKKILTDFAEKYGRGVNQSSLETFGNTGKTFLSDKALANYMADLDKAKPKIKPRIRPKQRLSEIPTDKELDKLLAKNYTKKVTPREDLITTPTKNNGQTLTLTKTQTKTVTDSLTKTATKNITTSKTSSASKTKNASLTGSKTKYYAKSQQATINAQTKTQTKPLFATVRLNAQATQNMLKFMTGQKVLAKTMTLTKTSQKTIADTKTDSKTLQKTSADTKTAVLTKTSVATQELEATITKTITKPLLAQTTPTINPFIKIPTIPIPVIKFPLFSGQNNQQNLNKTKLYVAQVRVKNNSKWKNVSQKPQPYNKAYNEGLDVADNTVGQSVRTVYKKTINKFMPDDSSIKDFKFRNKKYKSKIPSNPVKIEKRQFAIDTYGEKQGLSIAKYLKQRNARNKTFINKKGVKLI